MALAITEEHAQLAGSVQAWAQRNSPVSVARAAADGDGSDSVYRDALRPGLAELCVAVSELGRAIVPGSFLPTVLASAAMVAAGCTGKGVASLAGGHGNGAIALAADLRAQPGPDGAITVTGRADCVLGAPGADVLVLPVHRDAD